MAENGGFLRLPGRTFSTLFYEFLLTPFGGHLKKQKYFFKNFVAKIFYFISRSFGPKFCVLMSFKDILTKKKLIFNKK